MKLAQVKARLRQRYIDGMAHKVVAFREAMDRLQHERQGGDTSLRTMAHQLRGTAGSFGFPEIGAMAKNVEYASDGTIIARTTELVALLGAIHDTERAAGARMRPVFDHRPHPAPRGVERPSTGSLSTASLSTASLSVLPRTLPRILIVEDDSDMAMALTADLQEHYRTTHVDSGERAIERLDQERFDLALLDYHLPGRSGMHVAEILRRKETVHACPVIFLTADESIEVLDRAFAIGAIDYVTKPYHRRELLARLARGLERHP